jgi:hypothetical protein
VKDGLCHRTVETGAEWRLVALSNVVTCQHADGGFPSLRSDKPSFCHALEYPINLRNRQLSSYPFLKSYCIPH